MIRHSFLKCGGLFPETCALVVNRSATTAMQHDLSDVRPFSEIPGPKPLPLIGNVWRFIPGIGDLADADFNTILHKLYNSYGKIVKLTKSGAGKDMVYLFDPQYIETAFRNEGTWPLRTTFKSITKYREETRGDFFQGIIGTASSQGKKWHEFRTKVNQPMMQPRNAKMYVEPIDGVAKEFIERMKVLRDDKGQLPEDFIEHIFRWALESISLIALDTRLGCLQPNLDPNTETEKMITAVHKTLEAFVYLDVQPFVSPLKKRMHWNNMVEAMDLFNEKAIKYIYQARDRVMQKSPDADQDLSVLEILLIKNEDPKIAFVMALDMMLAGVDTTGQLSSKVLHYLSRNKDKQDILYEEVKRIMPNKDHTITAKDLEEMKYLKACIKETTRISPIIPSNFRNAPRDIVIANYLIPAGTEMIMGHGLLSRLEEYYPEPMKFLPERWLKNSDQTLKANPFITLPFGFGPRMCIGRRFAELEMETLIANIIRNFRLHHDEDIREEIEGLLAIVNPLNFVLEERP